MTQAVQVAQYGSNNVGLSFKNRIINGDMRIDQRNAGASVNPVLYGQYTLDRWQIVTSQTSKLTVQQSSVAPTGFKNSVLVTSSSAYSIGSSDYFFIRQRIEGYNTSDLGFGTANPSTVTVSFWVRSSLTGTFGGSLINGGDSRAYPFTYTINVANTWEQKSVTVTGDTTGTWYTDNNIGIVVNFAFGVGSTYSGPAGSWAGSNLVSATGATSVVGTNGATFYITGVQLEKGSTATSFDYRPYGTELALCQRYFQKVVISGVSLSALGGTYFNRMFFIPMRAAPTISISGAWVGSTPSTGSINAETFYWASGSTTFYSNNNVIELISAEL